MRILIAIPDLFSAGGDGRYGSTQPNPQPRLAALTQCLHSLRTLYAGEDETWYWAGDRLQPGPANQESRVELEILICTCGDQHLLDQLPLPSGTFEHLRFDCDPSWTTSLCWASRLDFWAGRSIAPAI